MRTYDVKNRYGIPKEGTFISASGKTGFDFFGFLVSDKTKVSEPEWFAGYMDSMKYDDGSYDASSRAVAAKSAPRLEGTCYALCAMKALGIEPPREALDYIERLKKGSDDGSFASGPHSDHGEMESTHGAVLALRLCGRPVPKKSADYVRSLRNPDGSFGLSANNRHGTLMRTRQALCVLRAAGVAISSEEKDQTRGYIMSMLDDEGFGDINRCHDAIVALNLLGAGLGADGKEVVKERMGRATVVSEAEKFKALAIRRCLGIPSASSSPKERIVPGVGAQSPMKEACYAVWRRKLEAYR